MQWGDFQQLFKGFAWKRLTAHEVNPAVSNGHEFQGVNALRDILGRERRDGIPAKYLLLSDDVPEPEFLRSTATWYNAREGKPRSAEWRLYYYSTAGDIQKLMSSGDLLVVCVTQTDELLILLTAAGSQREEQLRVLFNLDFDGLDGFRVRPINTPLILDYVSRSILEELGIADAGAPRGSDADIIEGIVAELIDRHGARLPTGTIVSGRIRTAFPDIDAVADPDGALLRWIEAEEAMYRSWEDRKIAARLLEGFVQPDGHADVASFRQFSMALRQSRVSRAGGALQYHFRQLLDVADLQYVMEPEIDGGERPDFLFPSKAAYEDPDFPAEKLRMLGAKFTAKDRWRQVLNEARRIEQKQLLTMEAGISGKQLNLMQDAKLTLVIPLAIRNRYAEQFRTRIMSVHDFLAHIQQVAHS